MFTIHVTIERKVISKYFLPIFTSIATILFR